MPHYKYQCQECENEVTLTMRVSDFLKFKKEENICKECGKGKIFQVIRPVHGKIYKDKESIIQEAKEEARVIVDKINKGDEKTFVDIYGDKPNLLKNTQ